MTREFTIFTGTANPALAKTIVCVLGTQLGRCVVERYPDGNVACREVFLMQSTSPPASDNLLELLALADACRRAGAGRITAIVPYFGHGRADKRNGRREPIMARVIADVLEVVGVDKVVVVDLHTPQIEGFFRAPVDSLTAVPILCQALAGRLPADIVVVSPHVVARSPSAFNQLRSSILFCAASRLPSHMARGATMSWLACACPPRACDWSDLSSRDRAAKSLFPRKPAGSIRRGAPLR